MNGYALNIGINYCNPLDLANCQLDGALPDARALMNVTDRAGFRRVTGDVLTDEAATAAGIREALTRAAALPADGDLLIVTFNGFGVVPSLNLDRDVVLMNRGWVTSDSSVVPVHEFLRILSHASAGARVLVVSACCFTGPDLGFANVTPSQFARRSRAISSRFRRSVNMESATATFAAASGPDDSAAGVTAAKTVVADVGNASVYHLCASGIDEPVSDGTATQRSPFVQALLELLSEPKRRSFADFLGALRDRLDPEPQLEKLANATEAFDAAGPFLSVEDEVDASEPISVRRRKTA